MLCAPLPTVGLDMDSSERARSRRSPTNVKIRMKTERASRLIRRRRVRIRREGSGRKWRSAATAGGKVDRRSGARGARKAAVQLSQIPYCGGLALVSFD